MHISIESPWTFHFGNSKCDNEKVIHTAFRSFSSTTNPVSNDMSSIDMVASLSADRYLWSQRKRELSIALKYEVETVFSKSPQHVKMGQERRD